MQSYIMIYYITDTKTGDQQGWKTGGNTGMYTNIWAKNKSE